MKNTNPTRVLLAVVALNLSLLIPSTHAAGLTWSGSGGDDNWNTGANWAGTAPVNNDNLIFNGTARQNNTNNINGLLVGVISFNNGGFTLKGNPLAITNNASPAGAITNLAGTNVIALDLNIATTPATPKFWTIAAGSELQIAGALTNSTGANPLATMGGGGTLRITSTNFRPARFFTLTNGMIIVDGGIVAQGEGFRMQPPLGAIAAFHITNNGYFSMAGGGNLRMGQTTTGGSNRVDISSGTIEMATTSGGGAGDILLGEAANTTNLFNQTGGLVTFTGNGNNRIAFANASATAFGAYNLSGGTLNTKQIVQVTAGAPGGTFNFNGGTLKPTASSTTFFQGVQTANVQAGGAIIDTTNFDITIGQPLPGVGGLTKRGTGTLTLSATNTYVGTTTIGNGTLAISTRALAGGGALAISNAATLKLSVAAAGSAMQSAALNIDATAGVLTFDTSALGNPTTAPIVATNIAANGTTTINVSGSALAPGTFELIHFTSASGLGNFVLGSLPLGVSATLVTNATSVSLNISSAVKSLAWSGFASGDWDTSSVDWKDLGNASNPTNYTQSGGFGDIVKFDDTALSNTAINVTLAVTPVTMTVSNSSLPYTFSGAGQISGVATLTKAGSGSLTFATANDFSGGSTVSAGTIRLGTNNALGSGLVTLTGGALSSDGANSRSLANAIKVTANTTLGNATDNGLVTLSNVVDLGGAGRTVTVNSDVLLAAGATNGILASKQGKGTLTVKGTVSFSGASDVQDGVLIYDGAAVTNTDRLIADTGAIGGVARLIITNGSAVTVTTTVGNLRSGRVTSTGSNYVDLAGLYSLPNADADNGKLTLQGNAAYSEMTFWPGGDFAARSVTNNGGAVGNTVFRFNGGILRARTNNLNFLEGLAQTLVLPGGANIDDSGFTISINQNLLDGGGGLTKTGNGTLYLNGANTYTGTTVVSNGTLGGNGIIASNVVVAVGAKLAAGTSIGTLTIQGAGTLGGTVVAEINRTNAQTADKIVFGAATTLDGILTVANAGPGLVSGDTFDLFDGPLSGFFTTLNLPNGPAHWNTSDLNVGGTITFTNISPLAADFAMTVAAGGSSTSNVISSIVAAADVDGDAVTITAVSAPTNGTAVIVGGTNITYFSSNTGPGDSFTYTVSDAFGGSDTKTVTVTVYVPSNFNRLSVPTVIAPGAVAINFLGLPGYNYALDWATNLAESPINWMAVVTNTAAGDGALSYTNTSSEPLNFFRTRSVP